MKSSLIFSQATWGFFLFFCGLLFQKANNLQSDSILRCCPGRFTGHTLCLFCQISITLLVNTAWHCVTTWPTLHITVVNLTGLNHSTAVSYWLRRFWQQLLALENLFQTGLHGVFCLHLRFPLEQRSQTFLLTIWPLLEFSMSIVLQQLCQKSHFASDSGGVSGGRMFPSLTAGLSQFLSREKRCDAILTHPCPLNVTAFLFFQVSWIPESRNY